MKHFDIGEQIVCVDNDYEHVDFPFTLWRTYEVMEITGKLYDNVGVINDKGNSSQPNWNRFISLKEYRKLKLETLKNVSH